MVSLSPFLEMEVDYAMGEKVYYSHFWGEGTQMVELLSQKWQNLSLNNDRMIKIQKSIMVEHHNAILP